MPVFGDFVANVTVDGNPLPEYAQSTTVDAQGVTVVACWVPSEADKAFTVRWRDTRSWQARPCTAGGVYADGEAMGGKLLYNQEDPGRLYSEVVGRNVGGVRRALVFSELDLTDDDAALRTGVHEKMGEIFLDIYEVHERSKKAGAHRVQLGAPLGVAADTMRRNERVGRSIVHFVFRYRPLAILQATGIAPLPPRTEATPPRDTDSLASRSQSPPPAPELTQAELDEEQRLKARLDELNRKRGAPAASGSRKKVKTEVKSEPLSHAGRFAEGNVIDLTDD